MSDYLPHSDARHQTPLTVERLITLLQCLPSHFRVCGYDGEGFLWSLGEDELLINSEKRTIVVGEFPGQIKADIKPL